MKIDYYISTKKWTGLVTTNKAGIIIEACPIIKWWIGNSLDTLLNFLRRKKQSLKCEVINEKKKNI